jgi:hypothetical protein
MAKTPEQIKAEQKAKDIKWNGFVAWYQHNYKLSAMPPAALKKIWMTEDNNWDYGRADDWIRNNDKNYKDSKQYKSYVDGGAYNAKELYRIAYGADYKFTKEDLKNIDKYAKQKPGDEIKERLKFFQNSIMKTSAFNTRNPGFVAWMKNNRGITDLVEGISKYQLTYDGFMAQWNQLGMSGPVPVDLMSKAMENNWDPTGAPFQSAMRNRNEYNNSQGYGDRAVDFQKQWMAIMPGQVR